MTDIASILLCHLDGVSSGLTDDQHRNAREAVTQIVHCLREQDLQPDPRQWPEDLRGLISRLVAHTAVLTSDDDGRVPHVLADVGTQCGRLARAAHGDTFHCERAPALHAWLVPGMTGALLGAPPDEVPQSGAALAALSAAFRSASINLPAIEASSPLPVPRELLMQASSLLEAVSVEAAAHQPLNVTTSQLRAAIDGLAELQAGPIRQLRDALAGDIGATAIVTHMLGVLAGECSPSEFGLEHQQQALRRLTSACEQMVPFYAADVALGPQLVIVCAWLVHCRRLEASAAGAPSPLPCTPPRLPSLMAVEACLSFAERSSRVAGLVMLRYIDGARWAADALGGSADQSSGDARTAFLLAARSAETHAQLEPLMMEVAKHVRDPNR